MAGNTKDAWDEVGEWGRMLEERYRKRGEELGPTAEEDRKNLDETVQAVTRHDQAFTSLGDTLRDPEAKQTLKDAAKAVGDAVSTTLSEAGEQIRSRLGSPRPSGSSDKTD